MANRIVDPFPQWFNNLGLSLGGGSIAFYVTGTTTPTTTYSNRSLSTPNQNPLPLDSAGRPQTEIWLDPTITYKCVLADSTGAVIKTADPVVDPAANISAALQVTAGNPNSQIAGTAGTVGGLSSSMAYDITNQILYVCTTTGTASSAVWTAVGAAITGNEDVRTTTHTVVAADVGRIQTANSASAINFPLTQAATIGASKLFGFKNIGAGTLTLTPNAGAGDLIEGAATLSLLTNQGAIVYCTGSAWRVLTFYQAAAFSGSVSATIFLPTIVTLTDGATPALDASKGTIYRLTSTQNPTIGIPTNPTDGQRIIIEFTASGGARTLSLNTGAGGFEFGTDITALSQTVSGKMDRIEAMYNLSANLWGVIGYVKGF